MAATTHSSVKPGGSWNIYCNPCFVFEKLCCIMHPITVICIFVGVLSDALCRELWHACAGPLVTLPREGERVYYFPEGHMEQVFLLG